MQSSQKAKPISKIGGSNLEIQTKNSENEPKYKVIKVRRRLNYAKNICYTSVPFWQRSREKG